MHLRILVTKSCQGFEGLTLCVKELNIILSYDNGGRTLNLIIEFAILALKRLTLYLQQK